MQITKSAIFVMISCLWALSAGAQETLIPEEGVSGQGMVSLQSVDQAVRTQATCSSSPLYEFPEMTISDAHDILARRSEMPPQVQTLALEFLVNQRLVFPNGSSTDYSLLKIDLSGGDFFDPTLDGGYFSNANFSDTNLVYASFCNAVLQVADFSNARLPVADFSGAYLLSADFSGAEVFRATFAGANISRANLVTAQRLTQAQVSSACYDMRLGPPMLPIGLTLPPVC